MESKHTEAPPRGLSVTKNRTSKSPCSVCKRLIEAVIFEDFEKINLWESVTKSWTSSGGDHHMTEYYFKGHYQRLSLIRQSAKLCDMCDLIVDHWPESEKEGGDPEYDPEYWIFAQPIINGATSCPKSFLIRTSRDDNYKEGQRFELFHRQSQETSNITDVDENRRDDPSFVRVFGSRRYSRMRRETHAYSGSDESFALAAKWMTECNSTHKACARTNEKFIPKRLLDTGAGDFNKTIRLCESHAICEPYAALSHCWGGKVSIRTTKANKEAHLKGIPIYNMPNTFRDAIIIVQKLGFRYLWIDALCIVQDCDADWQQEAAVMDKVYSRAALTISCADSANSWSGIFVQRKRQRSVPLHLSSLPGLRLHNLHVCALEESEDIYEDLEESVLNSRAWTLQERLLSHANLHFANKALIWECRTHTRTEDGHTSSSHPLFKNIANYYTPPAKDPILLWYIIVEDYSRRLLTYESDKLPALSGLERYFSEVFGLRDYLFGLWGTDLPRGLLWGRKVFLENITHRVPSWSWASRKGQISYSIGVLSESVPVKSDFDLHIDTLSTAGVLTKHLQVVGYLQESFYDPRDQHSPSKRTIGFDCVVNFWMDSHDFKGRCWCLYVGARISSKTDLRVDFLILEEELANHGELFKRIGTAVLYLKECRILDFSEKMNTMMRSPRRIRLTLI